MATVQASFYPSCAGLHTALDDAYIKIHRRVMTMLIETDFFSSRKTWVLYFQGIHHVGWMCKSLRKLKKFLTFTSLHKYTQWKNQVLVCGRWHKKYVRHLSALCSPDNTGVKGNIAGELNKYTRVQWGEGLRTLLVLKWVSVQRVTLVHNIVLHVWKLLRMYIFKIFITYTHKRQVLK